MLYNYMYLYIIAKNAYDIFVTDMRTEIETMDVKGKKKRKKPISWTMRQLSTRIIILYTYNTAF